jgi:ABC-type transporter Mla subunit MlaD
MSSTQSQKITSPLLIGIFIVVGSVIIIATIIWLGANQFLQENILYSTYFSGSVEGLQTGSPVKYQGVPVGTVNEIRVAPNGKLVEVVMQIEKGVIITDSLRVKVEMAGIAGGKFLQLHYPDNPEMVNIYPALDFKPKYPVIKSSPSGMQEIEIAMRDVLDNLRQIKFYEISSQTIKFLEMTSKFFANDQLYSIVSQVDSSAILLRNILKNADTSDIIDNLQLTSQKLLQVSVELDYFTNTLNNQLDEMKLTQRVDKAFSGYDSAMVQLRRVVDALGFRTETMLFGMNEAIEEVKSSNRQMRKSLRAVSESPTSVLFSEPPPPEK